MSNLPKTYKAVVLEKAAAPLVVKELPLPELKDDLEILVKVEAAPINPADHMSILGLYAAKKPFPNTPGMEGAGVVVAAKGEKGKALIGKRVGFTPKQNDFAGSYAEYCVSTVYQALPLPDDVSFEVGASHFVNPFTVACMLKNVQDRNVKAVVHTAAASQLGRMMVRYFNKHGVEVINVVRKQEQVDILKKLGAKYILNQNDEDFDKQLTELSEKLGATIGFEAIAGEMSGRILAAMPDKSTLMVYGGLSGQNPTNIGVGDLIFKGKTLTGFWLTEFFFYKPEEQVKIQQLVASSLNAEFKTELGKTFKYESANEAFQYYAQNMTAGKNIIRYNGEN